MKQKNFIIIISSPSGAGKTSLTKQLLKEDPNLALSVSVTTRAMRPGEIDGVDYFFINQTEFKKLSANNEFLEEAKVFDNYYASLKSYVSEKFALGKDVIFDIDWQGAEQLKNNTKNHVVSIFILPPSLAELERRLKSRAQDSHETIAKRMDNAILEIGKYNLYDYVLINENFNETLRKISSIIEAERIRNTDYSGFINDIETKN